MGGWPGGMRDAFESAGWIAPGGAEPGARREPEMEDDEGDRRPLLADPPCVRCGHAAHPYLSCGGECECEPTLMPGAEVR